MKNMLRYIGYLLYRSSTDSTKLRIPQEKNFSFYSSSNLRNAYGIRWKVSFVMSFVREQNGDWNQNECETNSHITLHDTSIRFGAGSSSAARVKLARCDPHRFENLDRYDVNKYRARKGNRKELVPVGKSYWYTWYPLWNVHIRSGSVTRNHPCSLFPLCLSISFKFFFCSTYRKSLL